MLNYTPRVRMRVHKQLLGLFQSPGFMPKYGIFSAFFSETTARRLTNSISTILGLKFKECTYFLNIFNTHASFIQNIAILKNVLYLRNHYNHMEQNKLNFGPPPPLRYKESTCVTSQTFFN